METKAQQLTQHNSRFIDQDIDPEFNFLNISNTYCHYTEEHFNKTVKVDYKMFIIHFKSLYANFHNIRQYLSKFVYPFSVTAISEPWINMEKGVDFKIDRYELNFMNRKNKNGGGGVLFVGKHLKYKVVEKMTVVDNILGKRVKRHCTLYRVSMAVNKKRNL